MLVLACLLGSIPTALLVGLLVKGTDIRTQGSGNAGATNAARILGVAAGILVAVVDVAKGFAAVTLVSRIAPLPGAAGPALCGMAAIIGHVFPVFAGFRGGKGVATAGGAILGLLPLLAPICFACFLVVAALSRRISLASICGAFALPAAYSVSWLLGTTPEPWRAGFSVAVFLMIVVTHRANIGRLLRGEEKPLDFGKRAPRP